MKTTALYSGSIGINNKVPSHRLPFSDGGVSALENATDVLVGNSGDLVARRGYVQVASQRSHSLWKTDGGFYVAVDDGTSTALYKAVIDNDSGAITMHGVRSGLANGARFSYFDLDDKTFYTNGYDRGFLIDISSYPWPVSIWAGAETTKEYVATPIGKHIDIFSGRALLSVNDELFFTEYGLLGIVDAVGGRVRFEGNIRMIVAVNTGVFVSTDKAVYFLSGRDPNSWESKKLLNYPALEYGSNQTLVDPSFMGFESGALSALFSTVNGPVIGLPTGEAVNLIDKKVVVSDDVISHGSVMVVDESIIIQSGE